MHNDQLASTQLMAEIQRALDAGEHWIAGNMGCHYPGSSGLYFFKTKDEAYEFAGDNISDCDCFKVVCFSSVADLLKQLPYQAETIMRQEDPDANGLFNRNGNFFTDALNDHWEHQQLVNNKINTIMNDKNFEYLKDNIKYLGFGDKLYPELESNMKQGKAAFELNIETGFNKDKVSAVLHFKKSDESDMFFFNKYDLQLKKENSDEVTRQTFYPNKSITLKEGYNLLDGRAVYKTLTNKENEKYTAWLQLDFKNNTQSGNYQMKQYHHNYGFNLEETLSKYPIIELQNEKFKESLIRSLERGNLQSATFLINGKEEKIFLTPNVAFKALSAFDANMKKIKLSDVLEGQIQGQSNKQEKSQKQTEKSETNIAGVDERPVQKKSKRQKVT